MSLSDLARSAERLALVAGDIEAWLNERYRQQAEIVWREPAGSGVHQEMALRYVRQSGQFRLVIRVGDSETQFASAPSQARCLATTKLRELVELLARNLDDSIELLDAATEEATELLADLRRRGAP